MEIRYYKLGCFTRCHIHLGNVHGQRKLRKKEVGEGKAVFYFLVFSRSSSVTTEEEKEGEAAGRSVWAMSLIRHGGEREKEMLGIQFISVRSLIPSHSGGGSLEGQTS